MMGELMDMDYLGQRLKGILEWKNLTIQNVYGAEPYDYDTLMAWLEKFGGQLRPYICDAGSVLRLAQLRGKNILFEAQLGALRDIDYGIYPYTSSSTPLAAYAPIGCGAPDLRVDEVLGIVKAYSTCVGEGPFTAEWFGAEADKLREAGGEYGAATGRPRRDRAAGSGGHPLRGQGPRRHLHRPDQAGYPLLHGGDPRLHCL